MNLADLFSSTAEVPVEYKNLKFILSVFTEKLTPAYKARAIALASKAQAEAEEGAEAGTDHEPEVKDETATMLADLIESWKDGDGEEIHVNGTKYEPTYANLAQLSYPLLTSMLREVTTYLGGLANPRKATS